MKSSAAGKNTSVSKKKSSVEVSGITRKNIWILLDGKEYNLPYKDFPWFKNASIVDIYSVQLTPAGNLRWKSLDVDIEIESLKFLDQYPLVYKL